MAFNKKPAPKEEPKGKRPTKVMRVRQSAESDVYQTIAVGWDIEINGKPAVSWKFSSLPLGWDGSAVEMEALPDKE